MTIQNFSDINSASVLNLKKIIQEFEYRKAIILTFFERSFAKKAPNQRREFFFALDNMSHDFDEGWLGGHNAQKAPNMIKQLGFNKEWTKNLMFAYWFSMPVERKAFTNHILAGVVATRSELKSIKPATPFYNEPTSVLGNHLYSIQNSFVWPYHQENALSFIAANKLASVEEIAPVVKNAQEVSYAKGLKPGVQALVSGLMPYFFRSEKEEVLTDASEGLPYEIVQSVAEKKETLEPFLNNFSWLFLTQAKYYQDMEVRMFSENAPKKLKQTLLPVSFEHTRAE